MSKQSAIKYSAENTTEEQADKLVQETTGRKKKVEAKRILNERENTARKLPQKYNEKKLTKVSADTL